MYNDPRNQYQPPSQQWGEPPNLPQQQQGGQVSPWNDNDAPTQVWSEQSPTSGGMQNVPRTEEFSPWNANAPNAPLAQTWSTPPQQQGNNGMNPSQYADQSFIPGQFFAPPASGRLTFSSSSNGRQRRNMIVILASSVAAAILVIGGLLLFVLFNNLQSPSPTLQQSAATAVQTTPVPTDTPVPSPTTSAATPTPVPTTAPTSVPTAAVPAANPTSAPYTAPTTPPVVTVPTAAPKTTPTPVPTVKATATPKVTPTVKARKG